MSNHQVSYPKDNVSSLYPNDQVGQRVTRYSDEHSSSIPKHIVDYHAHIQATEPKRASYMISISQAKAMAFLAKIVAAKRVLEIGVYTGLSMLTWSHAVGPDGKATGLELDPYFASLARDSLAAHGIDNSEVIVGDALETLSTLTPPQPYDIVFIDAQKTGYSLYLSEILRLSQSKTPNRLLRPGGLIIGDNALRCGFVADNSEDNPWRNYDFGLHRKEYWKSADVSSLNAYNEAVVNSETLENWLCPLWDGINIARLLD